MTKKKVPKVKRAKAGKGKKESKHESKADKESDSEKAKANAALWELRLKVTEQSLVEYREACRKLARANEELTNQLYRAEKDSIDITGFLKKQDAAKAEKVIKTHQRAAEKPKKSTGTCTGGAKKLVDDYTRQINEMKELFRKKSSDFNMIQDGMKRIKEFEKRKAQMEQELSDIRENMDLSDKKHRENLNKVECRFFKEKDRLEKEAERTIAVVVERAHNEAIENVRLNEALKYHIKEAEDLHALTRSMAKEKASLELDKNAFELTVKRNAAQMEAQKKEISKLRAKVASLEHALELKAEEPEIQEEEKEKALVTIQASQVELDKLQKVLHMRERELGHVKRLASSIVDQRTELEQFFHEALAQVKQEIMASRQQYKKEALQAYRQRLKEATAGKLKFPPIRTFHKGPHSTNSVYSDLEAAARTHQPDSKVEISDLTWEQKEQVLRLLFAKMNGQRERKDSQHMALSASSEKRSLSASDAAGIREDLSRATFITQGPEPALPPNTLPDIHTT
ncbi:hypothetical protein F7725_007979 [Dissostichus mawsoni]|uniref:Basal body-orientation factor 1 n=1 Tax=Dissostichus mawsoni TaxID=36200 RepID=A0A7J5Y5V0_DISMA|nr:hypothetical protein F7725_007979 [Dissostichus mawsoni]